MSVEVRLVVAGLLLVSLVERGAGGGWYQDRPRLTVDYVHGPLADTLTRYRYYSRRPHQVQILADTLTRYRY